MLRHSLVALSVLAAASGCKAQVTATTRPAPDRRPVAERHHDSPPPHEVHDHRTPPPPPDRPPPPMPGPDYAAQGWILMGEKWVDGKNDRDTIVLGGAKNSGTWTKLMLAVEGSDLKLNDLKITYGNGQKETPKMRHHFREGSRSAPIDLRGKDRAIQVVDLADSDVNARDGRARVQLWGRAGDGKPTGDKEAADARGGKPEWDSNGWDKLGDQVVDGKKDHGVIKVGKKGKGVTKLMMVVSGSDLELGDLVVVFGNDQKWSPETKQHFREGGRTRALDLPGEVRNIKRIEFKAGNLPGGGRATLEIWGKG